METGKRNKVTPLSRAAVAVGADGLMVEVHHEPDKALSDGAQSLYPDQFDELMTSAPDRAGGGKDVRRLEPMHDGTGTLSSIHSPTVIKLRKLLFIVVLARS